MQGVPCSAESLTMYVSVSWMAQAGRFGIQGVVGKSDEWKKAFSLASMNGYAMRVRIQVSVLQFRICN